MRPLSLLLLVAAPAVASAQSASLAYRLGKDTLAIEQFTRTATGMTGRWCSARVRRSCAWRTR